MDQIDWFKIIKFIFFKMRCVFKKVRRLLVGTIFYWLISWNRKLRKEWCFIAPLNPYQETHKNFLHRSSCYQNNADKFGWIAFYLGEEEWH